MLLTTVNRRHLSGLICIKEDQAIYGDTKESSVPKRFAMTYKTILMHCNDNRRIKNLLAPR